MKVLLEKTKKNKGVILRLILLLLCAMSSCLFLVTDVFADMTLLTQTERTAYVGDQFDLHDYFATDVEAEGILYEILDNTEGSSCIKIDEAGNVSILEEGTAVVSITYQVKDQLTTSTEQFTVHAVENEEKSVVYGEIISYQELEASNWYEMDQYSYRVSYNSLRVDEADQSFIVQGFKDATIYMQKKDGLSPEFAVATVCCIEPRFEKDCYTGAVDISAILPEILGFTIPLEDDSPYETDVEVIDNTKVVWKSDNTDIASFDGKGFAPIATGITNLCAEITAINGDTLSLSTTMKVSDPVYDGTVIAIAVNSKVVPNIQGIYEESTILPFQPAEEDDANTDEETSTENNSDENIQTEEGEESKVEKTEGTVRLEEDGSISGISVGEIEFKVNVDGRILTIPVVVTNPKPSATYFGMYKKQKKTLVIKGLNKTYSHYKFSSSKSSVASINAKGVITAKKIGHATISVIADGRTIKTKIEVSTKTGYKAARKAIAISKTKTHYSQIKRMWAHYYDCSSLVSRVYRPYGVYFGVKKGWSPTAAAIGSWCAGHGKVLSYKKVDVSKLVPGDLICYSYTKNGRYRNISHIEIYAGNGQNVSASSSNNRVILYDYHNKSTVLVARPTK